MKSILLKLIAVCFLVGVGVIGGLMIGNFPYITLKNEVGFGDIANFIVAIGLAIFIPIMLTKWLDGQRHIKDFLIDEIRDCVDGLDFIKEKVDGCNVSGKTSEEDKREIMSRIKTSEMRVNSLITQLAETFKRNSGQMRESLYQEAREYWDETTGSDLMVQEYNINNEFCQKHNKAVLKMQTYLKRCAHSINQF